MFNRHDRRAITSRLRLRGYDYSTPGDYVVTICTECRACILGTVEDECIVLSPAGQMVESWWDSIPRRFPGVALDERIVMPNHFHGIVTIELHPASSEKARSPSLSRIMQWFKGMTTNDYMVGVRTQAWPRFHGRLWQKNFYEHIIGSERELERMRQYIAANPSQWSQDINNPDRTHR